MKYFFTLAVSALVCLTYVDSAGARQSQRRPANESFFRVLWDCFNHSASDGKHVFVVQFGDAKRPTTDALITDSQGKLLHRYPNLKSEGKYFRDIPAKFGKPGFDLVAYPDYRNEEPYVKALTPEGQLFIGDGALRCQTHGFSAQAVRNVHEGSLSVRGN